MRPVIENDENTQEGYMSELTDLQSSPAKMNMSQSHRSQRILQPHRSYTEAPSFADEMFADLLQTPNQILPLSPVAEYPDNDQGHSAFLETLVSF